MPGYDAMGNETSNTIYGSTFHFVYDDEDRLTSLTLPNGTVDSFTYNGIGLRTGKTDSTGSYAYVCDGTSPGADVLADGYAVYTPGLSDHRGSTSTFSHSDFLGSLRFLTDSNQNVTMNLLPDAFGETVSQAGSLLTPFAWNGASGYQSDSDGLKLLGNRYYDPRIGRFITQDPIGDGDNWYAYADNSPANEVDPLGLQSVEEGNEQADYLVDSADYNGQEIHWTNDNIPSFKDDNGVIHSAGFVSIPDPSSGTSDSDMGFGGLVDQAVTGGLVAAAGRDWDSHPTQAKFEAGGAAALVVATAVSLGRGGVGALAKSGCFVAGTPVQEDGKAKPIETICAGEMVATRNIETKQTECRKVVRTFQHLAHDTVTVEFADAKTGQVVDTLTATPEHPFYVVGQGMTALSKLGIGTLVVTRAGPPVVVHSLVRHHSAAGVVVYNLEVEGDHTYFVGNNGEWVHNNCIADAIANGHAFTKHILNLGEFKGLGIRTVQQFADHIADVMQNGTVRSLSNGRTAFWDNASGTVVIHNPGSADLGTAFQPANGISYFNNLH